MARKQTFGKFLRRTVPEFLGEIILGVVFCGLTSLILASDYGKHITYGLVALMFMGVVVIVIMNGFRRISGGPTVHCAKCGFELTGRMIGQCPSCEAPAESAYRQSPRKCLQCGYILTGNKSKTCPECGTIVGSRLRQQL